MEPIEKCPSCPRYKMYRDSGLIDDGDKVCNICQITYRFETLNEALEVKLKNEKD